MGESVEAGRMVEFRQDHQIEQTVVEHSIWAKRHTASGLPPVADREGHERSFPRKVFRTEAAAVRREFGKTRDAGQHVGQSAQAPLEIWIGFHGNARTKSTKYEFMNSLLLRKPTSIHRGGVRGRRVPGPPSDLAPARPWRGQNRWRCPREGRQVNTAPADPRR